MVAARRSASPASPSSTAMATAWQGDVGRAELGLEVVAVGADPPGRVLGLAHALPGQLLLAGAGGDHGGHLVERAPQRDQLGRAVRHLVLKGRGGRQRRVEGLGGLAAAQEAMRDPEGAGHGQQRLATALGRGDRPVPGDPGHVNLPKLAMVAAAAW